MGSSAPGWTSLINGKTTGHQKVTRLEPNQTVELVLADFGPIPQDPVLTFNLREVGENQTEVELHFRNRIRRPFQVPLKLLGGVKWVRGMHVKDLAGLEAAVSADASANK